MSKSRLRPSQDGGAVLVQVGIALLVLLAFSALVVDYGILWLSRAQAQNAADAGALAGAVSLAFDSNDRTASGPAATKAAATANQNYVWGQPAGVTATLRDPIDFSGIDWMCPDGTDSCIRVNVYRNTAHNNGLPVFFARLFGVTEQGVQAMAKAQAAVAVSADCLRPWAISDKWLENYNKVPAPSNPDLIWDNGWSPASEYDIYVPKSKNVPLPPGVADVYTPPSPPPGPMGTGFSNRDLTTGLPLDYGKKTAIKLGTLNTVTNGWAMKVDFPLSTGGSDYGWNIKNCNPGEMTIASPEETCAGGADPSKGCFSVFTGADVGNTDKGVFRDADSLWNQDIAAGCNSYWDPAMNGGIGGIHTDSGCSRSKRLVPIPLYDVDLYARMGGQGTNPVFKMVNIVGFFIEGYCGDLPTADMEYFGCKKGDKDMVGRIVDYPGLKTGSYNNQASFIKVIRLVR